MALVNYVYGKSTFSRRCPSDWRMRIPIDTSCSKKPADLEMKTESFAKRILGAAGINDFAAGLLDYNSHIGILYSLADFRIYCAGHVAHKFLTNVLPYADIYDIQEISTHTFPKELPTAWCGISHNPRYCSLAKLWNIVHFVHNVLEK